MRVIGYVRVSSEEQSKEGVSLTMQAEKIHAYCGLNDLELVEIIEDAGISAKNITGRPGFQKALDLIFSGQAEGLVVWKLDRAFRSTQDALSTAEKLTKKKKALISINEKLDTASAIGGFFFTLMASLAEMERKLVGERTTAALQSKKSKGERVGRIPFGYFLDTDGVHLHPDPEEQATLSVIRDLQSEGATLRGIARKLNDQGRKTKENRSWTHVQIRNIFMNHKQVQAA
jgi:DNA invertase Pin-like site-specific DNA recombinase